MIYVTIMFKMAGIIHEETESYTAETPLDNLVKDLREQYGDWAKITIVVGPHVRPNK